jgi:Lrp/AsnC family leucine-responsive transcriptional regulator
VLDRFDLELLNLVQRDDSQTAETLATKVPLAPSTIARRLRKLRTSGFIARTIAVLGKRLIEQRLRAIVLVELNEHADVDGKAALEQRFIDLDGVQICCEIAGPFDFVAFLDCRGMDAFNGTMDKLFAVCPTVRRTETHFVTRELKFAPFVSLGDDR